MPELRDSVKCKYCWHFKPESNQCLCGGYRTKTEPDSVCKSFSLSPTEVILKKVMAESGHGLPKRGDGTYITEMPQFMRDEFEQEEEKEFFWQMFFIMVILGIGLLILWLIFGPFIIGIFEMISGILDFLS